MSLTAAQTAVAVCGGLGLTLLLGRLAAWVVETFGSNRRVSAGRTGLAALCVSLPWIVIAVVFDLHDRFVETSDLLLFGGIGIGLALIAGVAIGRRLAAGGLIVGVVAATGLLLHQDVVTVMFGGTALDIAASAVWLLVVAGVTAVATLRPDLAAVALTGFATAITLSAARHGQPAVALSGAAIAAGTLAFWPIAPVGLRRLFGPTTAVVLALATAGLAIQLSVPAQSVIAALVPVVAGLPIALAALLALRDRRDTVAGADPVAPLPVVGVMVFAAVAAAVAGYLPALGWPGLAVGAVVLIILSAATLRLARPAAPAWLTTDRLTVESNPAVQLLSAVGVGLVTLAAIATLAAASATQPSGLAGGTQGSTAQRAPLAEPSGDAPSFSHDTGFYDEPLQVEITTPDPGATIYYTLDGSYPDPDVNPERTGVYDGPLLIEDRTPQPNTISMIPTTVPGHRPFVAPDHELPKGTVLRARTAHSSAAAVATYFVGDLPPHGELAVAALTIDPDYLFDHDIGIHVGGRIHEQWLRSEDFDEDAPMAAIEANYQWRGREWERPLRDELANAVSFEFCDTAAICAFQQDVGVRVHGGFSRMFPNKSLRLYARNDYGASEFDHDFFGDDVRGHRRLILRNSGNDWNDLRFADAFFQGLMGSFHADTQAARPTVLYINGEYWGIHHLRERQDAHYLATVHGADPDRVEILDNSTSTRNERRRAAPPDEDFYRASPYAPEVFEDWLGFVQAGAAEDPQSEAFAELVDLHLDVDSFYDFIIAHTFPAVADWVENNSRWWRQPVAGSPGEHTALDGRWRFKIADLDSWAALDGGERRDAFTERLAPGQDVTTDDGIPALFNTMMEHDGLREEFVVRFADHLNAAFAPQHTIPELRRWEELLEADIGTHGARWSTRSTDEWRGLVDELAGFLESRPDLQRQHLRERFDLGDDREITVVFDPTRSDIDLNTIPLGDWLPAADAAGEVAWTGTYFHGQTLRLTAIPHTGARFSHWLLDGDTRITEQQLELPVDGDVHLRLVLDDSE